MNVLLRGEVLMALATFGDEKTQEEAIRRFEALLSDRSTDLLSADTKRVTTRFLDQIVPVLTVPFSELHHKCFASIFAGDLHFYNEEDHW